MGVFEMITTIVIFALLVEAFKSWRRTGGKFDKEEFKTWFSDDSEEFDELMGGSGKKVKSLEAEVATLKARIETLEAIVTDSKYQLDKEFANLK